jgi:4-hydroxythreonine-4-phosphate dehydrogenase
VIVVSLGCPAGIGPEVSVAGAARFRGGPCVLVGDPSTIFEAARVAGVPARRLSPWQGELSAAKIWFVTAGPELGARDRRAGKPTPRAGAAQLAWIDAAYDLARVHRGAVLVTGPVNKAAIARSGAASAAAFRGHTEWLMRRDGARSAVMCFVSPRLATSLVTTHLPLSRVAKSIDAQRVASAAAALAGLLRALGNPRPRLAVASLNPHAGESTLLGSEERRAIVPGIALARRRLGREATLFGPIGAETAYRKALGGDYDGVVAMYHDQATIPMKLVAFGSAVNVTVGLSVSRTSVDHGTAYDIAWQGGADSHGMQAAMKLAARLARGARS